MKCGLHLFAVLLLAGISCSKSNNSHASQMDSSSDTSANILTYQIDGASPQISFSVLDDQMCELYNYFKEKYNKALTTRTYLHIIQFQSISV
jgi:hypothetical protein